MVKGIHSAWETVLFKQYFKKSMQFFCILQSYLAIKIIEVARNFSLNLNVPKISALL